MDKAETYKLTKEYYDKEFSKMKEINNILALNKDFKNLRSHNPELAEYIMYESLIPLAFEKKSIQRLKICNELIKPDKFHPPRLYSNYSLDWPEGWRYLTSLILENCCQKCGLLKS